VKRNDTTTSTSATTVTGLRQRKTHVSKQSEEEDDNDNTWTHVNKNNDLEEDYEEMKLLQQDPIDFFGLPTHDLKLAQEHAKLALEGYIQAANQAAQI
jgi:hypothetical protein